MLVAALVVDYAGEEGHRRQGTSWARTHEQLSGLGVPPLSSRLQKSHGQAVVAWGRGAGARTVRWHVCHPHQLGL